ncbi:sigma-E factor regulatory protein RseB domain-containing protein [Streptomyces scabiei]|uniref:LolA family protein n=1 Tax=Streptomyces scabiei TaxID=1930 RepID=UPI002990533E|nr:sigma-E factor regulatory protein RseB domain-containing protein [Streptomyces scabiei]MDW8810691.1 sigma-E factor regulatory protein RseB domain-containing protein [Streptomyces scabiei]
MAPYETDDSARSGDAAVLAAEAEETRSARRRKAARYVVPVTVLGVAAATIGLVPAFAGSGDPDLPKISAQELIEKIAASDVEQVSGTVKITTDLGLPDLGGLAEGLVSQAAPSGGDGADGGSAADPSAKLLELAAGTHTLRVATDGPDKQKLSLLDDAAEYSVIHNGDDLWAYDSASNEVYHATGAGEGTDRRGPKGAPDASEDVSGTPQQLAEEALKAVDDTTSVTVDGTARVAGRDAYKLVIEPKQSGSTVGAISIAVDAKTGLPLKFTLTPASGGSAVVDAGFTKVDFGKPSASTFDFTPPKGAKVTEADEAGEQGDHEFGFGDSLFGEPGKGEGFKDGKNTESRKESKGPRDSGKGPGEEYASGRDGFRTIGKGWSTIAVFDDGSEGGSMPTGGESSGDAGADGFLNSLGDPVKGEFGSGTVFKTRLINVLFTDDGTVYAGAVTKDALVKAADAAK